MGGGNTDTIVKQGKKVSSKQMQPGDIVFFDTYKKNGHVGIYVGNGKFIGAQSKGVGIADMTSGYWKEKFSGNVRRVGSSGTGRSNPVPMGKMKDLAGVSQTTPGTYNNYHKTQKEALKSSGYQTYKKHLTTALQSGAIPKDWVPGLTELIGRESTWNPKVKNGQGSSAYGYGQFLKDTRATYKKKFPNLNYDNPVHQIILTAKYVQDRYGTIDKALKHWDSKSWY